MAESAADPRKVALHGYTSTSPNGDSGRSSAKRDKQHLLAQTKRRSAALQSWIWRRRTSRALPPRKPNLPQTSHQEIPFQQPAPASPPPAVRPGPASPSPTTPVSPRWGTEFSERKAASRPGKQPAGGRFVDLPWNASLSEIQAAIRIQRAFRLAQRRNVLRQRLRFCVKAAVVVRRKRKRTRETRLRRESRAWEAPTSEGRVSRPRSEEHGWDCAGWLQQLGIDEVVKQALMWPLTQADEEHATAEEQLQFMRLIGELRDETEVKSFLLHGATPLLDNLAGLIWRGARRLCESTAIASAGLHGKFTYKTYELQLVFGTFSKSFNGGLAAMVGEPQPDVLRGMRLEHTESADSRKSYVTTNFEMRTTSEVEWYFVNSPEQAPMPFTLEHVDGRTSRLDHWPDNSPTSGNSQGQRKPLPLTAFEAPRRECNQLLSIQGWEKLREDEFIAARLYTGPMYMKYNSVLRGLPDVRAGRMACQFQELCCGNKYTNTLHALSSCVLKLSKLTSCTKVYRGVSNRVLPRAFYEADDFGIQGGVEHAFLSCSTDMHVALAYAEADLGNKVGFVLELQQGVMSRGADLSWLSQYHVAEAEVCFPPLTALEVRSVRVENDVLVIQLNPTVNQHTETLEKVISRMQSSHVQLLDMLREELRSHGAPPPAHESLDRLRRRAVAAEPQWFNQPAAYEEATLAALAARGDALTLLSEPHVWASVPEEARTRRMRQSAELCSRLERHDVSIRMLTVLMGKPKTDASEMRQHDFFKVVQALLGGGLPAPWPATLARLLHEAEPSWRSNQSLKRLLEGAQAGCKPLFDDGAPALAYHPKYRWLPANICGAATEVDKEGWPRLRVTFAGDELAVPQEQILSVATGGLGALLRELAALGDAPLVAQLLELGVSGSTCDEGAVTALHLAAQHGHARVCEVLIDAARLPGGRAKAAQRLSAVPNSKGESALQLAVQARATDARRVLESGSTLSPLAYAARNGQVEELQQAVERGEDLRAPLESQRSLLHLAAECGSTECVALLLRCSIDPNCTDADGQCPLVYASSYGHTEVVRLLLAAKGVRADLSTAKGETAVHRAAHHGHHKTVVELVKAGASVDACNAKRETPLLKACTQGHVSVVQRLLDSKARLEQLDKDERSCLMLACRDGHVLVLRELLSTPRAHLLLNLATKASGGDSDGFSALHFACRDGYSRCAKVLIDAGAFVDLVDARGRSPLYLAAMKNEPKCVKALLRAGAQPDLAAADGSTAQSVVPLVKEPWGLSRSSRSDLCLSLLDEAATKVEESSRAAWRASMSSSGRISIPTDEDPELKRRPSHACNSDRNIGKAVVSNPFRSLVHSMLRLDAGQTVRHLGAGDFESVAALREWLHRQRIDTRQWGVEKDSKTVEDLWNELEREASTIVFDAHGAMRQLQVAKTRVYLRDETSLLPGGRRARKLHKSISTKMRAGENPFSAASRGIRKDLEKELTPGSTIEMIDDSLFVYVEHTPSASFPALRCVYELHRVDAELVQPKQADPSDKLGRAFSNDSFRRPSS